MRRKFRRTIYKGTSRAEDLEVAMNREAERNEIKLADESNVNNLIIGRTGGGMSFGFCSKIKLIEALQNLEDLKCCYPNCPPRSYNHKFKSNNWLKLHGEAMRRKPFKRKYGIIDEFYMLSN